MEDWASLGQHKRKSEIPFVTRESRRNSRKTTSFPTFLAHLRMRPVSRGNLRRSLVCGATCQKTPILWSSLHKNPCPDTSSKATLWMKSQHEGALTTPCIIWKNPQVPHTARQVACHLVNNLGGKQSSIPPHSTSPESPVPTQQGRCNRCLKWRETVRFLHQL